ncbi:hypothetical protein T08_15087 [Trichinella sp. T8]|nr:hypothetical protein T08_15087 [Trichinella sp. T8]
MEYKKTDFPLPVCLFRRSILMLSFQMPNVKVFFTLKNVKIFSENVILSASLIDCPYALAL